MPRNQNNRENQKYPYGGKKMDRYEAGREHDLGFSDDSDFDSNSSMYRRGRSSYESNPIDRDFDLSGRRGQYESDFSDERSSNRRRGQQERNTYRPADYTNFNARNVEGGFDLNSPRREDRGHFNKGPKGWKRSDERITEDVSQALSDSYSVDASDIEVMVKNGEVTLTGTVDAREAKREAERCVEAIRGVIDVHNQLRVKSSENAGDMRRGSKLS